jgi:hypothetical protein
MQGTGGGQPRIPPRAPPPFRGPLPARHPCPAGLDIPRQPRRALCHRLYRDLQDARALPGFFRRRAMRIDTLRDLHAGECRLYVNQRARANAQAAMNGFINSLAAE